MFAFLSRSRLAQDEVAHCLLGWSAMLAAAFGDSFKKMIRSILNTKEVFCSPWKPRLVKCFIGDKIWGRCRSIVSHFEGCFYGSRRSQWCRNNVRARHNETCSECAGFKLGFSQPIITTSALTTCAYRHRQNIIISPRLQVKLVKSVDCDLSESIPHLFATLSPLRLRLNWWNYRLRLRSSKKCVWGIKRKQWNRFIDGMWSCEPNEKKGFKIFI